MSELEKITATLGQERTNFLLQAIVPQITSRSQALLVSLNEKNWEQASQQAHKILSTANLFASGQLLKSLIAIESVDLNQLQRASFPRLVARQLKSSLQHLTQYPAIQNGKTS